MLVDDNFTMRVLLRGILRSEENANYSVVGEASDAESAMEMALRLKPDIVFLDIVMPKGNGLDVLKQLRAQLPQTVVLMVTSSHDSATVMAAIDGGASGFIVKPFNSSTILNEVKQAVEKSRTLRAAAPSSGEA